MSVDLETAQLYRKRAEELRAIAADASSADIRPTVLKIAVDYQRMA